MFVKVNETNFYVDVTKYGDSDSAIIEGVLEELLLRIKSRTVSPIEREKLRNKIKNIYYSERKSKYRNNL